MECDALLFLHIRYRHIDCLVKTCIAISRSLQNTNSFGDNKIDCKYCSAIALSGFLDCLRSCYLFRACE